MTTLTDIAAALREHSPGVLPKSIDYLGSKYPLCVVLNEKLTPLPDDIAAAVLRDAMVMDCEAHRCGWSWFVENSRLEAKTFDDSYHGNSSLLSCYAAWKWARGIE